MDSLHNMLSLLVLCLFLGGFASAYVPAQATNDTSTFENNNPAMLTLRWGTLGLYNEVVSYQLVGNATTGTNQGAIVHFTDDFKYLQNISTPTPWIAFISCDNTADNSSSPMGYDAFSSANDQGAIAALLYSETSAACKVNDEYLGPKFDRVMDIFTTTRASAARLIESQFSNLASSNYTWFNASRLTAAEDAVLSFIQNGGITNMKLSPGFLMATLAATAGNSTNPTPTPASTPSPAPEQDGGGGSGGTGLAMIILYSITGCVSALFCVVILSGAIRAIRNPERYGPRAGHPGAEGADGAGQTRTAGLTRAILDTFPIIKFGRSDSETPPRDKDVESVAGRPATNLELGPISPKENSSQDSQTASTSSPVNRATEIMPTTVTAIDASENVEEHHGHDTSTPRTSTSDRQQAADDASAPNTGALVPEAIGRETCPICIVDFEIGDDLRVLPCPGKHRFHQQCVDPWLLELSSSCPICREDFAALETMVAAAEAEADVEESPRVTLPLPSTQPSRFSRYMRFAQGRRNRSHRGDAGIANAGDSSISLPTNTNTETGSSNVEAQPHAQ